MEEKGYKYKELLTTAAEENKKIKHEKILKLRHLVLKEKKYLRKIMVVNALYFSVFVGTLSSYIYKENQFENKYEIESNDYETLTKYLEVSEIYINDSVNTSLYNMSNLSLEEILKIMEDDNYSNLKLISEENTVVKPIDNLDYKEETNIYLIDKFSNTEIVLTKEEFKVIHKDYYDYVNGIKQIYEITGISATIIYAIFKGYLSIKIKDINYDIKKLKREI